MKRIIKKILNYKPETASIEERDMLCAQVSALALSYLSHTTNYVIPDNAEINFASNSGGTFGLDGLKVNENIFLDQDRFVNDITTLAHELCHYAQTRDPQGGSGRFGLVNNSEQFDPILKYLLKQKNESLYNLCDQIGLMDVCMLEEEMNFLFAYFRSFYSLQAHEKEASELSFEFLESLIAKAKSLDLNESELSKLKDYEDETQAYVECFRQGIKEDEELRSNPKAVEYVRNIAKEIRAEIFEDYPNFWQQISTLTEEEINESFSDLGDPYLMMVLTLELAHDEELAHNLFECAYSSKIDKESKANVLLYLSAYTDIVLTLDELKVLDEMVDIMNESTGDHKTTQYFLEEKYRLAREKYQYIDKDFEMAE